MMSSSRLLTVIPMLALIVFPTSHVKAQVLTSQYDNARTGANLR